MKCIAYVRVSSKEQDEEVQRKAIEEFAKSRNIEVAGWYVDKGESGAKAFKQRPAAQRLLQELATIKPECVLCWSIDRLGRTMIDTLNTIIELEESGVKVISIKEEWLQHTDPSIRKLLLSVLAWFAEFERRRIRERQEEAWKMGKQKGRPEKISKEEVEYYLRKYRDLSLRDLLRIINSERKEKGKHTISYWTLYKKVKELGYKRRIVRE